MRKQEFDALGRELGAKQFWSEDDARRVVAALTASGDTLDEFARKLGMKPYRLARWRARLQQEEQGVVVASARAASEAPRGGATFAPVTVRGERTERPAVVVAIGASVRVEIYDVSAASAALVTSLASALGDRSR